LSPLRGLLFEQTLRHRFELHSSLDQHARRVSHVFCSTDVEVGEPFYFLAMRFGGFFWSRRRGACASTYPIAKAVRASAAYPFAFLPKRVKLKNQFKWHKEPGRKEERYESGHAYCADGGVSNNLGSQWFDENDPNDHPYRNLSRFYNGAWQPGREFIELTVDASGPLRPMDGRLLWFPPLGDLRGLRRAMGLLYENTLAPRRGGAAWELSEINNAGYAKFAAEGRFVGEVKRRGVHRRTLVPLDPDLPIEAGEARPGRYLLTPPNPYAGPMVVDDLTSAGMRPETVADLLAQARRIPTTLFKLSRSETLSALLSGYLATMVNCERYEQLGMPESLPERIARIQTLL